MLRAFLVAVALARAASADAQPLSPRNANYTIDVKLDARARTLSARETIVWTNITAVSTSELQFHLYYNAWRNEDSTWMRERPFSLPGGIVVRPGAYAYQRGSLSYQLATQRKVTGTLTASAGGFYDGDQTTVGYNGRVELTSQLAVEPRISISRLDFAGRAVTTQLYGMRTTFGVSPRMFVAALLQYNSAARLVGLNTRFRWEYAPGSDFFLVYSEGRDTSLEGFRGTSSRQIVAKFTRLFRF